MVRLFFRSAPVKLWGCGQAAGLPGGPGGSRVKAGTLDLGSSYPDPGQGWPPLRGSDSSSVKRNNSQLPDVNL